MRILQDNFFDLILELKGESITIEKFRKGVDAFFGVVESITESIYHEKKIHWLVQVKAGSNLVCVKAAPQTPFKVVENIKQAIKQGIETLEDKAEQPKDFSLDAIKKLQVLAQLESVKEEDDTRVQVWVGQIPLRITHNTVAHIADIIREEANDYGSVQGRLQTISERGGFYFVIYEPIWDKSIRCKMSQELITEALNYFGKRVEVIGLIKYRKDGSPISIKVEQIIPFPEEKDIPGFQSVRGILED